MAPGIDPWIQERWAAMWDWLCREKKTRAHQQERLTKLAQLTRDEAECAACNNHLPTPRQQQIRLLQQEATFPFEGEPNHQLYACRTGIGLVLVYADPSRWRHARERSAKVLLRPRGFRPATTPYGELETIVTDYATFPPDQVLPWGTAAAVAGYLFALVSDS